MLAMSTYFADENTKQIAVRKVFGRCLQRDLAECQELHVTWWGRLPDRHPAGNLGLKDLSGAVRLPDQRYGWVFAVAVMISLAIAFGTVLWQTLQGSPTNPATELKKE